MPDITGFVPLSQNFASIGLNLCKQPPVNEGLRCVPIMIQFGPQGVGTIAQINLGSTGATPVISQLCSLFVDAINCDNDITIFFPDTNYVIEIAAGKQKLFPVFSACPNGTPPVFYVLNSDTTGNGVDQCNLICLNQFVPEFDGELIGTSIIKGLSSFGDNSVGGNQIIATLGNFIASNSVLVQQPLNYPGNNDFVRCSQYYIDNMQICGSVFQNDALVLPMTIDVTDLTAGGNIIGTFPFLAVGGAPPLTTLAYPVKISNLKYYSDISASPANNQLRIRINGGNANTTVDFQANIYGGIISK